MLFENCGRAAAALRLLALGSEELEVKFPRTSEIRKFRGIWKPLGNRLETAWKPLEALIPLTHSAHPVGVGSTLRNHLKRALKRNRRNRDAKLHTSPNSRPMKRLELKMVRSGCRPHAKERHVASSSASPQCLAAPRLHLQPERCHSTHMSLLTLDNSDM